jgi:hypothetical protein
MAKMGKILCGSSMLHPVSASHPCLVTFGEREDCLAVLMPMRRNADPVHGANVKRRVIG